MKRPVVFFSACHDILIRHIRQISQKCIQLFFYFGNFVSALLHFGRKLLHICHKLGNVAALLLNLRDLFSCGILLGTHGLHTGYSLPALRVDLQNIINDFVGVKVAFLSAVFNFLWIFSD